MTQLARTAGTAGSIPFTTKNTAGQLITPASTPVAKWYTDSGRSLGELALTVAGSGSSWTASWTAGQAPATPSTRYLKFTVEVSTGISDVDADDEISFVDATVSLGDSLDVLTLEEGRSALSDTAADADEATLALYITGVSRKLDELCRGAIVQRDVVAYLDGGRSTLFLPTAPVASVQSITEYAGTTAQLLTAETNGLKPSAGYTLDETTGELTRRAGGYDTLFPSGRRNIVVAYKAGRAADTESVEGRFKSAAGILLRDVWARWQGAGSGQFGAALDSDGYTPLAMRDVALVLGEAMRVSGFA